MTDFHIAYEITGHNEGGYCWYSSDKGGETYNGIAREFWPNWIGWISVDSIKRQLNLSNLVDKPDLWKQINEIAKNNLLLKGAVETFYKEVFWDGLGCNQYGDQELANRVYDAAVNCGGGAAGEWLQIALVASSIDPWNNKRWDAPGVDGDIGNETLGVLKKVAELNLFGMITEDFRSLRKAHHITYARQHPDQRVNHDGWLARS